MIINSVITGGQAVIDTLNVTPSTTAQQIIAPAGTDGYSPVNVSAVTSAIDANIVAGNIKNGVSILGVTGNYAGVTPTGTLNITSNGTHNVSSYQYADVNVPTTAPAYYIEKIKDANGVAQNSSYLIDLSTFTNVGNYVFTYAYYQNTSITGAIDLSALTTVSGQHGCFNMFNGCTGITSVDLSSLTIVIGQNGCYSMFSGCTGITGVDLSSLTTISGANACQGMFSGCTGITSIDLSALTKVSVQYGCSNMFKGCTGITSVDLSGLTIVIGQNGFQQMFNGCTNLTSIDLSSLTTITGQQALTNAFAQTGLTSLSFPALTSTSFGNYTNQLNNMLSGVTGCTVHFPSNLQSVIGSWSAVTAGFGGTNTTVLFDLPATVTLTGADTVTYTRNPKYDTATALAWKVGAYGTTNFTPAYYTSGTTDPAASATIYSDSACTTPVTTISSIA